MIYFLAHFDGPIPCKGFTTMLQSHLYQYDQVTLTAIDYLRMILRTAVSAGYRKIKIRYFMMFILNIFSVDLFVDMFLHVKLKLSLRIMNYLWRLLFFFFFLSFFHCDKHFQLFRFFVGSFRRMSVWRCQLQWLQWGDAKEIFGHTLNIGV